MNNDSPFASWMALANAGVLGANRLSRLADGKGPWRAALPPVEDRAVAYLHEAAALDAYRRAGEEPLANEATPAPPFRGDERVCSPLAAMHLEQALVFSLPALLKQWCDAARRADVVAPPERIPGLLTRATSTADEEFRQSLLAAAGQRGRWLAQFNADWRLAGNAEISPAQRREAWETGSEAERLQALRRWRLHDPSESRDAVASQWASDPAGQRATFLSEFATALSPEDEPFLESCLDDRSKQVRRTAAELLSAIPDSQLGARLAQRVGTWLFGGPPEDRVSKRLANLDLQLPEKLSPADLRDSLELKAMDGMGPMAALVLRLASLAPLDSWTTKGSTAVELAAAAAKCDWANALTLGWSTAAVRQRRLDWSEALLSETWLPMHASLDESMAKRQSEHVAALLAAFPQDKAQRLAESALQSEVGAATTSLGDAVLYACDFPWGASLSQTATQCLQTRLAHTDATYDHSLRNLLTWTSTRIDPRLADVIERAWSLSQDHWSDNLAAQVSSTLAIVRLRREMADEFRTTAQF
ncbi:MAG: hypothetical protein KDA61_08515 [Planctomycetales bacterium]|nr:hypothetical protein [Planctomycetales bacterium]